MQAQGIRALKPQDLSASAERNPLVLPDTAAPLRTMKRVKRGSDRAAAAQAAGSADAGGAAAAQTGEAAAVADAEDIIVLD